MHTHRVRALLNVEEGESVRRRSAHRRSDRSARRPSSARLKELKRHLVEVYRSQSVAINDKHIEGICRQMLRSVRVTRVGGTDFLPINRLGSRSIASASWKKTRR
jgi:DNA-directed RNA polymerase subunit beta'